MTPAGIKVVTVTTLLFQLHNNYAMVYEFRITTWCVQCSAQCACESLLLYLVNSCCHTINAINGINKN